MYWLLQCNKSKTKYNVFIYCTYLRSMYKWLDFNIPDKVASEKRSVSCNVRAKNKQTKKNIYINYCTIHCTRLSRLLFLIDIKFIHNHIILVIIIFQTYILYWYFKFVFYISKNVMSRTTRHEPHESVVWASICLPLEGYTNYCYLYCFFFFFVNFPKFIGKRS